MICLFIGGKADGNRISVPIPMSHYRVPSVGSSGLETTVYRPERFTANGLTITVYVENNLSIQDALRMMVDNYQSRSVGEKVQ